LHKTHDRSAFDCGNEALNRYLRQQARQDAERRVAATFVLLDAQRAVRGFYSLSASMIPLDELPPKMAKTLPRYDHLPVTLLGRLAVDRTIGGQGAGQFLLADALRRCLEGAQHVGAMAVIVDAKDAQAERFYRHFDFLPFQQTPLRLFLPMSQVAQLFDAPV
jgi:predicted GNAT family N-acyltransferase